MQKRITLLLLLAVNLIQAQHVITVAGMLEVTGSTDGPALESSFNNPHGLAIDPNNGDVYVVDRFGHKIRKYSQDGSVETIAGAGFTGNADGNGVNAFFNEPWGICVGHDGNVYVADTRNNLIRKINPDGDVSTFAGSGAFGSSDGSGINASFGNPTGIRMDDDGNLWVADHLTHAIRKITPSGVVSTVAGVSGSSGFSDGIGSNALFNRPYGLTIDHNGDILVADEWNHRIRRVTTSGVVTTIAGTGTIGHEDGNSLESEFNYPWDVTVDDEGNLYVADGYNQVIRKLVNTGSIPESYDVTTYAGTVGVSGGIDAFGENASFNAATSIDFWSETQEFYIADAYNDLLRKISIFDRPTVTLNLLDEQGAVINNLDDQYFCANQTFTFDAYPDTLDHYIFYVNEEVVQSGPATILSIDTLPSGPLTVYVQSLDDVGFLYSNALNLVVAEELINDFTGDELSLSIQSDFVNFTASVNDEENITYFWDFGDPDSGLDNFSQIQNPSHTYSGPGIFTVQMIVQNNSGCRDSLIRENYIEYIAPEPVAQIFVPSAFTPNGDGQNDVLYVRGEEIAEVDFAVFNQWGEQVFATNTMDQGWDGRYKGKIASNCTYTFMLKATTNQGEILTKTGHVSIIR